MAEGENLSLDRIPELRYNTACLRAGYAVVELNQFPSVFCHSFHPTSLTGSNSLLSLADTGDTVVENPEGELEGELPDARCSHLFWWKLENVEENVL